jgi:integrase
MLRWAVERAINGSNPLAGIKPLRHDNPKEGRSLTPDEIESLFDKSPQPWRDIWYALLVTGLRKEELANLRFADVDWAAREVVVRGSPRRTDASGEYPSRTDCCHSQEASKGSAATPTGQSEDAEGH